MADLRTNVRTLDEARRALQQVSATVVTDHGALTGLADDDHTQYHNDARGDVRYPGKVNPSVADNFVAFSNVTGSQKDSGASAASFALAGHTHSYDKHWKRWMRW